MIPLRPPADLRERITAAVHTLPVPVVRGVLSLECGPQAGVGFCEEVRSYNVMSTWNDTGQASSITYPKMQPRSPSPPQ